MDFPGRDGARLAYQETGAGLLLILIHGHMSRGSRWAKSGFAGRLAARGYRVIMPDLRAHGDSARPHDPAAYPPDVLADDGLALVDHLGLGDYDLVGHSLGGRTAIRMLVRGAAPRRAVSIGQGLEAIAHTAERTVWARMFFSGCGTGTFEPGSDEHEQEESLLAAGGDPKALLLALDSWVETSAAELAAITVPVLVVTGAEDWHSETAQALADAMPLGSHLKVPGGHNDSATSAPFEEALAAFLA